MADDLVLPRSQPGREEEDQQALKEHGLLPRIVSAVGRVVEQLSKIYGYAILVSGLDSVVIIGVSTLPFTRWNDEGVPQVGRSPGAAAGPSLGHSKLTQPKLLSKLSLSAS